MGLSTGNLTNDLSELALKGRDAVLKADLKVLKRGTMSGVGTGELSCRVELGCRMGLSPGSPSIKRPFGYLPCSKICNSAAYHL